MITGPFNLRHHKVALTPEKYYDVLKIDCVPTFSERIVPPAGDEGTCTWCGVPDMYCQCPDVDTNEGSWRADDVADSYEDEA